MMRSYLTPRALCHGDTARRLLADGSAWPLLGPGSAFAAIDVTTILGHAIECRTVLKGDEGHLDVANCVAAFAEKRASFAGVVLDRPRIMGIVNVTPDSFFDGGKTAVPEAAIGRGISLAEAGADIVDIGGESTRPGAAPVAADEEARRVLPVVAALANRGLTVSIDTRHAATMTAAISAGAKIVNDVGALRGEGALSAIARTSAAVILMHMQGDPRTMQINPTYVWAPGDIFDFLATRLSDCVAAGIDKSRVAVDPGIGFGQSDVHIREVYDHLAMFHGLGCPVAIGASRKGFIGRAGGGERPQDRLSGSLTAALVAAEQGVHIVRVHDVAEMRQAIVVRESLRQRA